MIHRYVPASKNLPAHVQEVLDSLIKIVNHIKSGALNTHLFKELCTDMNSDNEVLLLYTAACWLLKGNVVNGGLPLLRVCPEYTRWRLSSLQCLPGDNSPIIDLALPYRLQRIFSLYY